MIFVLEGGNIIESGKHEELLSKKGKYYNFFTSKIQIEELIKCN